MISWSPAQLEAKRRGEAHAVEMLAAGQAIDRTESKQKRKKGKLRPERWERCQVCHAPAVNPETGKCEMASCETKLLRSSEPYDHSEGSAIW